MRRLEDLSEDDFESNKDTTDLEAAALKEYAFFHWLLDRGPQSVIRTCAL